MLTPKLLNSKRRTCLLILLVLNINGYSLLSQLTLGHYLIAPIWDLSLKMNSLILIESFVAIPLLLFTLWSQFFLQEWKQASLD